jgi:hypothetical protein
MGVDSANFASPTETKVIEYIQRREKERVSIRIQLLHLLSDHGPDVEKTCSFWGLQLLIFHVGEIWAEA